MREMPALSELPVIVVSTLDRPADRLAGLESGADAYLTKQKLDARELITLVRRVGGSR
jgi:DNA-binding response OmpR family regulator